MTRSRTALYALLVTVAAAAAVLSFAALRDLALLCGFSPHLAWLLPVTVDAGAAAGSIVWLCSSPPAATIYARTLALLLLAGSVAGNAAAHGLEAYGTRPHWLAVVAVSAIAPLVLGSLVHLVVLVVRGEPTVADSTSPIVEDDAEDDLIERVRELVAEGAGRPKIAATLGISDHKARQLLRQVRPMEVAG